jgi:hypothetical protein
MELPTTNMDNERTLFSHVPPPYVVPDVIESELEWFFERGARDAEDAQLWDPDPRWGSIANRTIQGWLSAMDDYDAGVLKVAYSKGPKPLRLLRRLGRLTTVVVHLASVEAGWPEDPEEQRRLVERTATRLDEEHPEHGPRSVTRYIKPAVGILRTAVRAYARERGRGPSMVFRVSTPRRERAEKET